jgi:hypothetical protein
MIIIIVTAVETSNPTNGNILYKYKQVCAYGDDIVLIARNMPALQEMLITLQEIGVKYGLCINEDKTKYMKMMSTSLFLQYFQKLVIYAQKIQYKYFMNKGTALVCGVG